MSDIFPGIQKFLILAGEDSKDENIIVRMRKYPKTRLMIELEVRGGR
jgi:hypothetical protein